MGCGRVGYWRPAFRLRRRQPPPPRPSPRGGRFIAAAGEPRVPVAACRTRPRAACRCLLSAGRLDARFGVPDRGSLAVPRLELPHSSLPRRTVLPLRHPGQAPAGRATRGPIPEGQPGFRCRRKRWRAGKGSQNRCHRSQHEWPRRSTPCEDRCSTYFADGTARRLPGTPVTPVRVTLALGAPGAHNAAPSGQGEIPDRR